MSHRPSRTSEDTARMEPGRCTRLLRRIGEDAGRRAPCRRRFSRPPSPWMTTPSCVAKKMDPLPAPPPSRPGGRRAAAAPNALDDARDAVRRARRSAAHRASNARTLRRASTPRRHGSGRRARPRSRPSRRQSGRSREGRAEMRLGYFVLASASEVGLEKKGERKARFFYGPRPISFQPAIFSPTIALAQEKNLR
jgi:hypothetical protein